MTTDEILKLIDACRAKGVVSLKIEGVEFTLAPQAQEMPSFDPPKPVDPNKCIGCQVGQQERGAWCRKCYLGAAGVQS